MCFLDQWKELRSFDHCLNFDTDCITGPEQKTWKLTNFGVSLHSM